MAGTGAGPAAELAAIRTALSQVTDRPSLSAALDRLALLAARYEPALAVLMAEVTERDLAEIPIRAYFFDDALVDDAVQETLLAVARGVSGFRGEAAFLTWLDRVARHAAGRVRSQQLRAPVPVDPDGSDGDADGGVGGAVVRMSSLVANRHLVGQALAELAPDLRQVVLLREAEGLGYDEIARRTGVPLNTVRTRLRRARLQLAERLLALQGGMP
jgi:RNA polymerase sigma-70 factor (ECF subfamily)